MRGPFLGDPGGGLGVSLLIGVGASCAKASRNLCGLGGFGVRLFIGGGGFLGAGTGTSLLNVFLGGTSTTGRPFLGSTTVVSRPAF